MAPIKKPDPVTLHLSLQGSPVWLSRPGPVVLVPLYSDNGLNVQLPITLLAAVSPVMRQLLISNSCHQDEVVILLPAVKRATLQTLVTLLDTGVARVSGSTREILSSLGDLMEMLGIDGLFNFTDIYVDDTSKFYDKDKNEPIPEKVVKRCSLDWMLNSEVHIEAENIEKETTEEVCEMENNMFSVENPVLILREVDDLVYEESDVHQIQSAEEFLVEDEAGSDMVRVRYAEVCPVMDDLMRKHCDSVDASFVESSDITATSITKDSYMSVHESESSSISSQVVSEYQFLPPLSMCGGGQYPSSLVSQNPDHKYSLNKVHQGSNAVTTLYYCCVKKGRMGCKAKCKVKVGSGGKLELIEPSCIEHNHPSERN